MQPLTLTEVWSALRARRRVVAAGAFLGLLLGLAIHLLVPATYAATTVVQVEDADPARVDMAVEEAVANSRRVGAEALQSLATERSGSDRLDIEGLERAATARAVARSRVLEVTVVDTSPASAARAADAVAQAYLAARAVDAAGRAGPAKATGEGEREIGSIIDPARVPDGARGPGVRGWAVGGLALGLLATASVAAVPRRRSPAGPAS